jgi:hypothetical protein
MERLIAMAAIVPPTKAMLRGAKSRASFSEQAVTYIFPCLEENS